MEDFANILHRDYGLKPGGKSAPMSGGSHSRAGSAGGAGMGQRSGSAPRMANDDVFSGVFNSSPSGNGGTVRSNSSGAIYDDVFGGPPTGVRSSSNDAFGDLLGGFSASGSRPPPSQNTFTEDLLGGFGGSKPRQSAAHASSSSLDDIFSGSLGQPRTSSHNSFVNHDDDPFGSFGAAKPEHKVTQSQMLFDDDWNFGSSKSKSASRGAPLPASMVGDLLGGFSSSAGRSKKASPFHSPQSSPPRAKPSEPVFDEFLPGFGGGEQGKPKVVPDADAMRGIPIISTDDDDVFGSIPSSTSAVTPDPFVDIPGAKSSAEADPSRGIPSVTALDADEMRGIPPLSSPPIPDDDPFSSGAELDPFAHIIADSVPPPADSSYADPLDVFDLPPAASASSVNAGGEGASGQSSNGSGSYDPFDAFPRPSPVATAKQKEDPPPSRSGSGSEGREGGSQGSGTWEEKHPSRRGFGGVPFNVDLNEAPEVPSPTYPSGATYDGRTETETNGFASKVDDEPKFDEPSVSGVDERRRKHDTDKVPVDIFEERWLTVDDVKLVTVPSASRPPSRAPPRPGFEKRRSSRGSANHRDSAGERSRGRSDELPAYRSSRSNGSDASQEAELSRERSAAREREREAALVQKEREDAERERAARQRERAERQRERARERDRAREQETARSVEAVRERADSRPDSSNGRDDEGAERARRAAERAAKEAQQRMEKAAAERAIAEARERAEKSALARAAAARELAREKEQREKEQREREERERRDREERSRRDRAKEERERERSRREREERERERREKEEREKERERDRERDRRRERERGAAEQPRATSASASSRATSEPRQRPPTNQAAAAPSGVDVRRPSAANPVYSSTGSSPAFSPAPRRPQAAVKAVDDWTTLLTQTAPTGDEFQDMPGETPERRKLRLERHQKTIERAQQALKEKNDRDKALLMEQAERSRASGNLDAEIRRWATGKEGNLRALLSSLHLVLWPETNWKPLSLTDLIQGVSVKKAYQRAILCVHPDKVQQKGATVQQKYIAEKVFDLLKEAFAKFNSSELY